MEQSWIGRRIGEIRSWLLSGERIRKEKRTSFGQVLTGADSEFLVGIQINVLRIEEKNHLLPHPKELCKSLGLYIRSSEDGPHL
jgi:hypothetical protein